MKKKVSIFAVVCAMTVASSIALASCNSTPPDENAAMRTAIGELSASDIYNTSYWNTASSSVDISKLSSYDYTDASTYGTYPAGVTAATATSVTIQLKWLRQSQFMGYYVADVLGFYKEEGLNVTLVEGGTTSELTAVTGGSAQFGVSWVSNVMQSVAGGSTLVNIAQMYQKSGMTVISLKDNAKVKDGSKISDGEIVSNWLGGNQYELNAYIAKNGLSTVLQAEDYDMDELLDGTEDWASAMTYNELGLVMEAGKSMDELNVLYMEEEGVGMLEDCLFVDSAWASANTETVVKFLRASIKGWAWSVMYAPTSFGTAGNDSGSLVYEAGDSVSLYHQQYMASEVAKLILSDKVTMSDLSKIGYMDADAYKQTQDFLSKYYVA